jgi:hypothetical protein
MDLAGGARAASRRARTCGVDRSRRTRRCMGWPRWRPVGLPRSACRSPATGGPVSGRSSWRSGARAPAGRAHSRSARACQTGPPRTSRARCPTRRESRSRAEELLERAWEDHDPRAERHPQRGQPTGDPDPPQKSSWTPPSQITRMPGEAAVERDRARCRHRQMILPGQPQANVGRFVHPLADLTCSCLCDEPAEGIPDA